MAAGAPIGGAALVEDVAESDPAGFGVRAIARLATDVIAAVGKPREPQPGIMGASSRTVYHGFSPHGP